MGKAPKAPPPTDPLVSSAADQRAQTGTAIANTWMSNPQQYSPYGSQTHTRTGTEYTKDAQGRNIEIPTFTTEMKFSDAEQKNYDYENQLNWAMSQLGLDQLGRLDASMSSPVNADGLPEVQYDRLNKNYDQYREDALNKMRAYYQPELDRQKEAEYTALKNRGINENSEAYREQTALQNRQRNDAELQMYMGAGSEIDRAASLDQSAVAAQDTARNNAFAQRLALRNQPINEITALMGGNGVNSPQFKEWNAGQIRPTDVAGQYNHYDQMRMQQYQAQLQAYNAKMSGMFGMASAGIGGLFRLSDKRLKSNIVKLADDPRGFGWYEYTIFGRREVGVMAQELREIMPHAVVDLGGVLAVNYGAL